MWSSGSRRRGAANRSVALPARRELSIVRSPSGRGSPAFDHGSLPLVHSAPWKQSHEWPAAGLRTSASLPWVKMFRLLAFKREMSRLPLLRSRSTDRFWMPREPCCRSTIENVGLYQSNFLTIALKTTILSSFPRRHRCLTYYPRSLAAYHCVIALITNLVSCCSAIGTLWQVFG